MVCSAQQPLGAGAAARRPAAARSRWPLAYLCQQKWHDLLLFGRLAQDLKGTRRFPGSLRQAMPPVLAADGGGRMRLSMLGLMLLSTVCITSVVARAQDAHDHVQGQYGQGHAENHDWYKDLKQPDTGYSCCNGRSN